MNRLLPIASSSEAMDFVSGQLFVAFRAKEKDKK
jgi:hypothetical protein